MPESRTSCAISRPTKPALQAAAGPAGRVHGALVDALHEFSDRGINMVRIESRPMRRELGRYRFFIDINGREDAEDVSAAIAGLRDGADVTTDALEAEAERHVARYKLPKAYVFCERIQRSPSGKADYRWAKAQALDES